MSRVTLVVNRHDEPSETFQRSLAATLVGAGHDVTIHALRVGTKATARVPGTCTTEGLPPSSSPRVLATHLASGGVRGVAVAARRARSRFGTGVRAVRAALLAGPILDTRPDIVHLGFSGIGVALSDCLDLLDGVRIVVSCRGTDELVRPLLDERRGPALASLLGRADGVHAVAGAVARQIVGLGADPGRVHVIRPAVDLNAWTPVAPPPVPPFELVSVGRLEPAKGHDDVLAALAMVRSTGLDARLTVLGSGDHRGPLVLRAARTGLGDVIALPGAATRSAVAATFSRSNLCVLGSLSEGINNGVLEAMASGLPVVSTDVGGMAEVITDGVDGWLVPPGRPDVMARAIARALADPGARSSVGAAARRTVEDRFARARQDEEWARLYSRLALAGRR